MGVYEETFKKGIAYLRFYGNRSFEYILLLTQGGPGLFTTEVWALTAYKRALFTYFGTNQWGYGSAWALILVIIAAAASITYLRIFRFDDLVQEPKIDVL